MIGLIRLVNNETFYKLVPIDHAYSFPSCLDIGDFDICWMSWSQAEKPFTEVEKEYINSININGFTKKLERKLSGIDKGKKSEYLYYLIQGNK